MKAAFLLCALGALLSFAKPVARGTRPNHSSCSYAPTKSPKHGKYVCGQYGTLDNPQADGSSVTTVSLSACRVQCSKRSGCISLGYKAGTGQCQLYTNSISKQGFTSSASGATEYYDRYCFVKKCSTPVTPPATCGNQGIQYAIYPNNQGDNDPSGGYAAFDPMIYKTRTPEYNDVTTSVGGIDYPNNTESEITVYGSDYEFNSDYFVLNHRGYFFPTLTGSYTFAVDGSDDLTMFWVGDLAYSGWTRTNDDLDVPYSAHTGSYSFEMTAGQYYPFRIVFAQAQYQASFEVTITDPNGNIVVNSNSSPSDQVVQYSCDGTSAPAYPPFGSET